jgi:hypothetical protein
MVTLLNVLLVCFTVLAILSVAGAVFVRVGARLADLIGRRDWADPLVDAAIYPLWGLGVGIGGLILTGVCKYLLGL